MKFREVSSRITAKLLDFIENEYLPAGYETGRAWQFPRGEEFYALRARGFTTDSLTPDEIHELGLKEVARIRAEMEKVVKHLSSKAPLPSFCKTSARQEALLHQ